MAPVIGQAAALSLFVRSRIKLFKHDQIFAGTSAIVHPLYDSTEAPLLADANSAEFAVARTGLPALRQRNKRTRKAKRSARIDQRDLAAKTVLQFAVYKTRVSDLNPAARASDRYM